MTTEGLLGTVDRSTGSVRLVRTLPAAPREVWDALTRPERLGCWLAPVEHGAPGDGATFVLRMNDREAATCTVTTWDPPREFRVRWDYTGEGESELGFELSEAEGKTVLTLVHRQIPCDAVQYGAGWHAHLDRLEAYLRDESGTAHGCADEDFLAAYNALHPRYEAAATGAYAGR